MARKAETVFSSKVKEDLTGLERMGVLWHVKVQQVGVRGTPDYLINAYGDFVAIELKREEGLPADALQTYNLRKIEQTRGHSFLVSPENWPTTLQRIIDICMRNKKKWG